MRILGIETSCDETAVSIITGNRGRLKIEAHVVSSQIATHRKYGGVVPEVAARHHVHNMIPVIMEALRTTHRTPDDIDAIAVTRGPGLITSLRVGVQTAKTLSYVWNKPLIGVNHMEGHVYANWLDQSNITFPVLCLVVSGGHTQLILMTDHGQYRLLGQTRDDAAGEAFDKVAKMLKLPYPGGPRIQKLAVKGNAQRFNFPRPMLNQNNDDFSFAGLKTAVLTVLTNHYQSKKPPLADICASFQQAVIDVLVQKTIRAANQYHTKSVILAGGVAANQPLREQLKQAVRTLNPRIKYGTPPLSLCTDNATMIAMAGYAQARKKRFDDWHTMEADPNWELV
ncbi:MAG: tRNA (adenosine(37)-N6)-threonylcarbamoyltransferase complex transferase subunit TsaD [Candidatus Kerfeldbacteria bacterium]|nr:tRNA (adenosine(37)-N6)-threonylcarbamoyltransferase complex transferase subunit TsaD [Candidatus Kerfeldbacteria bacterium]